MKQLPSPGSNKPVQFAGEYWFHEASILDMDYFLKTISGMKAKGVHQDLIGSIFIHYASKWLPELAHDDASAVPNPPTNSEESPESVTASWMKKRFCVETLVGILPTEKDSIPCNFLLRLLRIANMVRIEPAYRDKLEKRIAWQLDGASLKELMIPSFSHTCGTLLDVELVLRLVKKFVNLDGGVVKSGAALVKVAKLVDCFLAEAAVDSNLRFPEFLALAGALPGHARTTDDGLYRAIDTYLKAHPGVPKKERKTLCRLIDCRKLSHEACLHAAENERLPVRAVIQILFSEQTRVLRQFDWSSSFSGTRSPSCLGLDTPTRCHSRREFSAQNKEIKRLRQDVVRLERQCADLQGQLERMLEKKKGFLKWKKLGMTAIKFGGGGGDRSEVEEGFGAPTPAVDVKTKAMSGRTPFRWWRKSVS